MANPSRRVNPGVCSNPSRAMAAQAADPTLIKESQSGHSSSQSSVMNTRRTYSLMFTFFFLHPHDA